MADTNGIPSSQQFMSILTDLGDVVRTVTRLVGDVDTMSVRELEDLAGNCADGVRLAQALSNSIRHVLFVANKQLLANKLREREPQAR